jgi:hypothetical protein
MNEPPILGLLAEFDTPEALVEAAGAAREAGFADIDAFTPFPVEGLAPAIGFAERKIPIIALLGGIGGAVLGYGMQVVANLHYTLDIGGRPLNPPLAYGLITFELTVLFAVGAMILGLFLLCRLPKLHHPLFDIERFEHATVDGFFLFVPTAHADRDKVERLLLGRDPRSIVEVAR